ncbi:MAG: MOSC domain-containing protein, partial [Acidimicrobiales bacterium]
YLAWLDDLNGKGLPTDEIAAAAAGWLESLVFAPDGRPPERWSRLARQAVLRAAQIRMDHTTNGYGRAEQLLAAAMKSADDPPPDIDTAQCITDIGREAERMAAIVREMGDDGLLALTGKVGERTIDGAWVARHAVHDATHHLSDTGRDLYALVGVSAPPAFGSVESINVSDGGVPKRPVPEVVVGRRGLEGDRQRSRKHHGRVWQALCLYSIDVIEALQEEGHPIQAGSAGENLTLRGIDWVTMRPGVRLQLGDAVAELTVPATPCRHNAQWFTHGDFRRMDHERYPGWSRWYAKVVSDGAVREGDQVIVDP